MSELNFNMDEAPKGRLETLDSGRKDRAGHPILVERYEHQRVIVADETGRRYLSKWLLDEKANDGSGRWEMFSKDHPPVGWYPWPESPFAGGEGIVSELTNARLAELLAYLAGNTARWSGDFLTLPEEHAEPVRKEAVARFLRDTRDRLDRIEKLADLPPVSEPRP
ncbi:hypothetical protein QBK99_11155 [Corticibacterium sp. UT-5YL-CI-8]|nr:hypothetical protein [Tianweitania sp. UT-5YL-CI-8]